MDPHPPEPDEAALRVAVIRGDAGAWKALYDRHFDALHAYIHFRNRHGSDLTDEAVQECWLIAVRQIRRFDPGRGGFEAWLRGIAVNVLRNQERRLRKHRALGAGAPQECLEGTGRRAPPGEGRAELAEEISLVFSELPARHQAVLRAKYQDALSVDEVARRWGETPKAIESLLARARAAFQEAYRRRDGRER
jgi:RNA polymerase sigma-70 factor (ECF subfamily)